MFPFYLFDKIIGIVRAECIQRRTFGQVKSGFPAEHVQGVLVQFPRKIPDIDSHGAGFDTGGLQPQCQTFAAEIALLDHTAHSGRKIGIVFFYKRPRILPVEAPRPIGTGRHTETAADTAVKIHGHDTVLLNHKGCLGGTGLDAGRIVAMVAECRKLAVLDFDSTVMDGETIDFLARETGQEEAVAKLTEAAMRGDIPGLVKASW